jgi:3'-5' exoribonuclease
MKERLAQHCEGLQHGLRGVVEPLVMTQDFIEKPAATFMHHAYMHGLIEHSLSVCDNCIKHADVAGETPCDVDVLVAGALLHDVGKGQEYTMTGKRLPISRELGHSLLGCEMLMQAAFTVDVDKDYLTRVRHVIASHHGRTEWGAVIEPQSKEAWLVHAMDLADSRVFAMEKRV